MYCTVIKSLVFWYFKLFLIRFLISYFLGKPIFRGVLSFLGDFRCSGFFGRCAWFSWRCSGFLIDVPGFLLDVPGFLGVPECSGDVPVFLEVLHAG